MEDFSSPTHLCNICLRKIQFRLGFDVLRRYQRLGEFFRSVDMNHEAKWIDKRVKDLLLRFDNPCSTHLIIRGVGCIEGGG